MLFDVCKICKVLPLAPYLVKNEYLRIRCADKRFVEMASHDMVNKPHGNECSVECLKI